MIIGDYNSTGHNLRAFRKFIRRHDFENWSQSIKYTYSQSTRKKSIGGTSGGLCNTKPDQVFTLNFPEYSLTSCKTDLSIVTKGGHLPIKTQAELPHIDIIRPSTHVRSEIEVLPVGNGSILSVAKVLLKAPKRAQ